MPGPQPAANRSPRLIDVVADMSEAQQTSLIERHRFDIDPAKRVDIPTQISRALAYRGELRDPTRLEPAARALLTRVVLADGILLASASPAGAPDGVELLDGAQELLDADLAFLAAGARLFMPIAYLLQVPAVQGEERFSLRALFAQMDDDARNSIASHYLDRRAVGPAVLELEVAWQLLADEPNLREAVANLHPSERDLLLGIEERGGEVDTSELLDLEREPVRLVSGQPRVRRGPGFALERRGFLVPLRPDRHVIPIEVAQIVGERRAERRRADRERVHRQLAASDHAPHRASFSHDPSRVTLALALAVHGGREKPRPGVGTPRTLIRQNARRLGQPEGKIEFLSALSRNLGLWDSAALSTKAPPGDWDSRQLSDHLFELWRSGSAWDEARPEPEVARAAAEARIAGATDLIRQLVLECLGELQPGDWVPWRAVSEYIQADDRIPGARRLVTRWARRIGVPVPALGEVARKMAFQSLHWLAVVDIGDPDPDDESARWGALRLTPRGKALLDTPRIPLHPRQGATPTSSVHLADGSASRYEAWTIEIGDGTPIGDVLGLATLADVGRVEGKLQLTPTAPLLRAEAGHGARVEDILARLARPASLPDGLEDMVRDVVTPRAHLALSRTAGFLWIEDQEVLDLLQRPATADLFAEKSPQGGLLLAPGVDPGRVARRCRALGLMVEEQDEQVAIKRGAE